MWITRFLRHCIACKLLVEIYYTRAVNDKMVVVKAKKVVVKSVTPKHTAKRKVLSSAPGKKVDEKAAKAPKAAPAAAPAAEKKPESK